MDPITALIDAGDLWAQDRGPYGEGLPALLRTIEQGRLPDGVSPERAGQLYREYQQLATTLEETLLRHREAALRELMGLGVEVVEVLAYFRSPSPATWRAARARLEEARLRQQMPPAPERPTATPPGGEALPALTDGELRILAELGRLAPRTAHQVDLEAADCGARGTIGNRLRRLETLGLVERPHGPRMGYGLTAAGRRAVPPPDGAH